MSVPGRGGWFLRLAVVAAMGLIWAGVASTAAYADDPPPSAEFCRSCHSGGADGSLAGDHHLLVVVRSFSCFRCHEWQQVGGVIVIPAPQDCLICHGPGGIAEDSGHGATCETAGAAHNALSAAPACGPCHGTSTFNTICATHNSDCALCHASAKAPVRAAIANGRAGAPVNCLNCHDGSSGGAGGHGTTCDTAGSVHNMLSATTGCASCHRVSGFGEICATHKSDCALCHASTKPDVVKAITDGRTGTPVDCWSCHTGSATGAASHSSGGHLTHLTLSFGPHIGCNVCHDLKRIPLFADGRDLAGTTVCNTCHSPGGAFDGVNDPVVGAKANWPDRVYMADGRLKAGKEKWCSTCHDDAPANSRQDGSGTDAPIVTGDNTTWGFYVTGHKFNCLRRCHDAAKPHIDHEHRTYDIDESNGQVVNTYHDGYRLKDIDGRPSMIIPRPRVNDPGQVHNPDQWALCSSCHIQSEVQGTGVSSHTNFRHNGGDLHTRHLGNGYPYDSDFDSGWGTWNSEGSCPLCHNVHGASNRPMVRHGELMGNSAGDLSKVPGFDFKYQLGSGTWSAMDLRNSVGINTIASVGGGCNTGCHANISKRTPYQGPSIYSADINGGTEWYEWNRGQVVLDRVHDGQVLITAYVNVPDGAADSIAVNLTPIGGDAVFPLHDDGPAGGHGDATRGDGVYSAMVTVPAGSYSGTRTLTVTARDHDLSSSRDLYLKIIRDGDMVWRGGGGDNRWSNPGNWNTGAVPGPGADVAFDSEFGGDCVMDMLPAGLKSITVGDYSGTLTLELGNWSGAGELALTGDLRVHGGVVVVKGDPLAENPASGGSPDKPHGRGAVISAANILVGPAGRISADGQGFESGRGPGFPGSYGGLGVGPTYGSASLPTALGSGGSQVSGGGAVKLNAPAGTVLIDGVVSADGAKGINRTHGGAGGSLWIVAEALAGSGAITAQGGGNTTYGGEGGGGGRIALRWSAGRLLFNGVISAAGGRHASDKALDGQAGTLWVPGGLWNELWNQARPVSHSVTLPAGEYTIDHLHVANGAVLGCAGNPHEVNPASGGTAGQPHGSGCTINSETIVVDAGAAISANDQGFGPGNGPGSGGSRCMPGASHGGPGGMGGPQTVYGSASEPTALGSGGGGYSPGGSVNIAYGGGAIKLNAGAVTIDGTVSANATQLAWATNSCGSGGSIWIISDTLAGSGAISANGSGFYKNTQEPAKGGGSGGRISLSWRSGKLLFDGEISAKGADGMYWDGGNGSIHVPEGLWNEFWNSDRPLSGSVALAPGLYDIDYLHIPAGVELDCHGDPISINPSSGGMEGNPHGSGVTIRSQEVVIDAGAELSADSMGFGLGKGPAPGVSYKTGASHGGGPYPYGSLAQPSALGSGGAWRNSGNGGGAIRLEVAGPVMVNGIITADGGYTSFDSGQAGTSGGSVWINADSLLGAGVISAKGGSGANSSGHGGRIAIHYTDQAFPEGTVTVQGGFDKSNNRYGEQGTIYRQLRAD